MAGKEDWVCSFKCGGKTLLVKIISADTKEEALQQAIYVDIPKNKDRWPRLGDTIEIDVISTKVL